MSEPKAENMEGTTGAVPARVQSDGTLMAACPECGGLQRTEKDATVQEVAVPMMTCTCGHIYRVFVEHRRAHRRHVELAGTYRFVSGNGDSGIAFIHNLSMTGVGFTTPDMLGVPKQTELCLQFTLDDGIDEEIDAAVVVRQARNQYVGCQFMRLAARDEDRLADFLSLMA